MEGQHEHEFGVTPAGLPRILGPRRSDEEGPYVWVSTDNAYQGLLFTKYGVEPAHIRSAATNSYTVLQGIRCRIIDIGSAMFETYGEQGGEPAAGCPSREFVFNAAKAQCSSSRLHLGGKVELVMVIRGSDGAVAARVRSAPMNLLSKPPRHRERRRSTEKPIVQPDKSAEASPQQVGSVSGMLIDSPNHDAHVLGPPEPEQV
eukprot:m51a1_g7425 hypothetical protein (203) ;mRNA; r:28404-29319